MVAPRLTISCLLLSSVLLLSACASTENPDKTPTPNMTATRPASKPEKYGDSRENLNTVADQFKRNPKDEYAAARYAKALRESGDLKKSESVLTPFLKGRTPSTLTFTEMGALELETGDFNSAENYARKSIKADNGNYRAWHILGIALDAQQKHPEAESAFRKAMSLWQGDDVPVMNNLALNLAAQGYTDKALDLLYQAQKKDPSRVEIERNIRIIRTLNEPSVYNLDTHAPTTKK